MLSFKEFLKEEIVEEVQFEANIVCSWINNQDTKKAEEQLTDILRKKYRVNISSLDAYEIDLRIFSLSPSVYSSNEALYNIKRDILDAIGSVATIELSDADVKSSEDDDNFRLIFNTLPKQPITSWRNIAIEPDFHRISLKDIHKIFPNANQNIWIYMPNRIKSNILGLLKLKGEVHFGFGSTDWLDMFFKHYRGDKDVLAFQEELLDAGLNEFAKL